MQRKANDCKQVGIVRYQVLDKILMTEVWSGGDPSHARELRASYMYETLLGQWD